MSKAAWAIIATILIIGILVLSFSSSLWSSVERSPAGMKGLEVWLKANGTDVIHSNDYTKRAFSEQSLRIVSLPIAQGEHSSNETDKNSAPRAISPWIDDALNYSLPTLVILPKWSNEITKETRANFVSFVPLETLTEELTRSYLPEAKVLRLQPGFVETNLSFHNDSVWKIKLYRAQVYDRGSISEACNEEFGVEAGALLIKCFWGESLYILADPDLLNNHGLALGENASFALDLIAFLKAAGPTGKPVLIDSNGEMLGSVAPINEGRSYERSSSDLFRMFTFPLSVVWVALLLITLICLWRGYKRFGAISRGSNKSIEISKTSAILANARLLRISGNDDRLLAQFVQSLLQDKAVTLYGPSARNLAGVERMYRRFEQQDEHAAYSLREHAAKLIEQGRGMSRMELVRHLEEFRKLLGSISLGFK